MAVVILVQEQTAVGSEVEKSLHRFEVFYLGMMKLIAQLPILKNTCAADVNCEHDATNADVPQRESITDVGRTKAHYLSSGSRRTKPRPRTVCSSFTGNGSSTFLRMRAICTSITLSNDV